MKAMMLCAEMIMSNGLRLALDWLLIALSVVAAYGFLKGNYDQDPLDKR